ncbi:phosphatase PAP2 family protein [Agromyces salentinus]|uniref:Phosphatidic acid phosphatase type 2/haloperoxidase domain-containing protein n=1 Tax=Agromyces salentinus TaxID=269421 RepID=A0ABN2MEN7_9MICO|nr:phosphatase PAP2 family protein [Agromyces salentinus]
MAEPDEIDDATTSPDHADARGESAKATSAEADAAPSAPQRAAQVRRVGRRAPLIAGIAAVVVAALLGLVIALRNGNLPLEVDEDWAEDVLEIHGPVGDAFALFMNMLGGGIVGVLVVPLAIIIVLLALRRPWAALYFAVVSAASALLVQLLKELVGRPRPEDMMVTSDFGSFPSGHVANAATIAVALGIIFPRAWVWVAGVVYTVLMAVSRTYLGVHWFTDTIGGALVGAGVALVLWAAFAVPLERERLARLARISERNAAFAQAHVTPPARR